MGLPRRFAAALFVAFLFYACQTVAMFDESVRYYQQWEAADTAAFLLGMLFLAVTAVGLDALVRRSKSVLLRRLFNHAFLLAVAAGFLAVFVAVADQLTVAQLLWLAAAGGIGLSLGHPQWKIDLRVAQVCSYLSPVVVVAAVLMASWGTWGEDAESLPSLEQAAEKAAARAPAANGTPVVFIVFDEWSFPRSTENGQFRSSLKNLRKLARQSVMFRETLSAGPGTMQSMPRMIYQNDKTLTVAAGETFLEDDEGREATQQLPSLFQLAGDRGYTTYLLGIFHAYRHMLGTQVDYCHVYPCDGSAGGLWETLYFRLMRNCIYLNDPVSLRFGWGRGAHHMLSRQWFAMATAYRVEMLDILANGPVNTFAFFHAPWPHGPFVFNSDGSYNGSRWDDDRAAAYLRQIDYVDVLVGEIVATLRAARKYDDALLILTSDHGWREDPEPTFYNLPDYKQHVPLIIKLPGQQSGYVVDRGISPNQLKPLLEAVFAGEKDPRVLTRLLGVDGDAKTSPQE
jgi:glucan phosphoethanolaminetransferase (alkaline phosphatase superfamily)